MRKHFPGPSVEHLRSGLTGELPLLQSDRRSLIVSTNSSNKRVISCVIKKNKLKQAEKITQYNNAIPDAVGSSSSRSPEVLWLDHRRSTEALNEFKNADR